MKYRKQVEGVSIKMHVMKMRKQPIDVYITSDKLGKTLSLCDGDTMLSVPLEKLSNVLKVKEGRY